MPDPFGNNPDVAHLLTAARRHALLECGELVGNLNIVVKETQRVETIAFNCTGPKHHKGECAFVGAGLVVTRRRRD